jgi:putative Mg2+ transporter-C (MgtC) family protein
VELPGFFELVIDAVWQRRGEALRLVLACALGGWIGLEREAAGKPAGFRTNLIICLGAALVTEISIGMSRAAAEIGGQVIVSDPGRIAAQVVSGIGFLGAGTIIQSRGSVQGLTTAATLWVVAMIGIGVGAQAYVEAIVATLLVITALRVLGRVDDALFHGRGDVRTVELMMRARPNAMQLVEERVHAVGAHIRSVTIERTADRLTMRLRVSDMRGKRVPLLDSLLGEDDIENVTLT